jgi:hypothetical protein
MHAAGHRRPHVWAQGLIWAGFDPKNQGRHDKLLVTVVVRRSAGSTEPVRFQQSCIANREVNDALLPTTKSNAETRTGRAFAGRTGVLCSLTYPLATRSYKAE